MAGACARPDRARADGRLDHKAALVAFADPEVVVLSSSWGPAVLDDVAAEFARLPRHAPVRAAQVTEQPSLVGARNHALHELQKAIIDAAGGATR